MNNYEIKYILRTILNVLIMCTVIYIVARLFIFLLPVIIVLIVLYYIYKIYVQTKNKVNNQKTKTKSKKIDVADAEIINERFDD